LTVVLFWSGADRYAEQMLGDLEAQVRQPFAEAGLAVATVNVGDSPGEARRLAEAAGVEFPVLLDADGALWRQVSTGELPRVFLLDREGTILWFDIGFTRASRRTLATAIESQAEPPSPAA
jgi:hypothetical protein